jgi:hypothetical protein
MSSVQLLFGDDAAVQPSEQDFYDLLDTIEVEEHADLPAAIQLTLPIATVARPAGDDLTVVDDSRFHPYARVAVVVSIDGARDACIFDGCVLAHTINLDSGTMASTAEVWGQDVSCLMDLVEKTQERPGSDSDTAKAIFGDYHFRPVVDDGGGTQSQDGHVPIQRGTDLGFLRERARRTGRLLRVSCDERPGDYAGYFINPKLDGEAVMTLKLNPVEDANVESLKFSWDVLRPTEVLAEALVKTKDPVDGGAQQSGLSLLDQRSPATFAGDKRARKVRMTASVDDAGELRRRAESLLREAGWFVRCEGEADLAGLEAVPRAGTVVQVDGAGKLHSGKYLVWSVRHTVSAESHRLRFVLVRNAVGAT